MALLNKDTRKQEWLEAIYKDFPDLKRDTLKSHFVDNMIEAYLADEKAFKQQANKDKRDNVEVFKEAPTEIIAISKVVDEKAPSTSKEVVEVREIEA